MRPVLTGWFAEFGALEAAPVEPSAGSRAVATHVAYGPGAAALAGATYDPTSHYRAAAVFAFHREQQLTPERLRALSRHQVGLLKGRFEAADLDPRVARIEPIPDERRGGFLAARTALAAAVAASVRSRQVWVDARGDILRLGPAPYLTDEQLTAGMEIVVEAMN
jgi:kynureninase